MILYTCLLGYLAPSYLPQGGDQDYFDKASVLSSLDRTVEVLSVLSPEWALSPSKFGAQKMAE